MAKLGKTGKGKNGKAGKTKGLKDGNEKDLQDKIRRMEESDYNKRLAAAAKKDLRDRLIREQKFTNWNKLKIHNTWRKIMRLAKVESLRKDIEVISQNHERDVDRKDAIIQMLDRDVEEAEEQYQMAMRKHLQNLDNLIDLQDARLLAMETQFERELQALDAEFNVERDQIVTQHLKERTELLDIMAAVEAEENEKEQETRHEYDQLREMIHTKNLEDIHVLQSFLDNTIEELERNFETAHLNYLQSTDQRTQDFKYLTQRDHSVSQEIEIKMRKIDRLQASLQHWKTKIAQNNRECDERNRSMREEKEAIIGHFQDLKVKMNLGREAQAKRLALLTKHAQGARDVLTDNVAVAERVLKLAEITRKLETEHEKVTPFYISPVEAAARAEIEAEARKQTQLEISGARGSDGMEGLSLTEASSAEAQILERFFKRYNSALIDKLTIESERDRLAEENANLQALLRQYLEGISVTPDIMSSPNPLLVVNGRLTLNAPPVRSAVAPTVVEAAHVVATSRIRM